MPTDTFEWIDQLDVLCVHSVMEQDRLLVNFRVLFLTQIEVQELLCG